MEYRTLYPYKIGYLTVADIPVSADIEPNGAGTPTWAPRLDWSVGTIRVSGHWVDHKHGVTVVDWIDLPDGSDLYDRILAHLTGPCASTIDRQYERALRAA